MQASAAGMQAGNKREHPSAPAKLRLLTLNDLDRRTASARRARALIESIEADLGGSDRLTTGERQIIQRAAVTGAVLEDIEARWLAGESIDPALYCTIGNAQRRLLESIGLQRRARDLTPTLQQYLAARAAEMGEDGPKAAGGNPRQPKTVQRASGDARGSVE